MAPARILIVEDQAVVAEDIENKLRHGGYTVAGIALSGEEALEQVGEAEPDLVLMDIRLSGEMNGIEAAEEIWRRFSLPVVYLTAYADEKTLARAKLAEPFGYLVKPVEGGALNGSIEMALYKHEMEQRLRASEERYRTLFENVPIGLYRSTPEGQNVDVNSALVEMLGFPDRESLLRQHIPDGYVNPQDRARWQALIEREGILCDYEMELVCYDGRAIWVRENTRAVRDGDGRVLYYEGSMEDITERKRAEEERERLIAELQGALDNVKTLRGLIPICAKCKKIRDDEGYWHEVEVYVRDHTEAQFTHGLCPDCFRELYPGYEAFAE